MWMQILVIMIKQHLFIFILELQAPQEDDSVLLWKMNFQ